MTVRWRFAPCAPPPYRHADVAHVLILHQQKGGKSHLRDGTMSLRTPPADIVPLTLVSIPPLSVPPPPFEDAQTPSISLSFCETDLLGWLTTWSTLALWGNTDHARNLADARKRRSVWKNQVYFLRPNLHHVPLLRHGSQCSTYHTLQALKVQISHPNHSTKPQSGRESRLHLANRCFSLRPEIACHDSEGREWGIGSVVVNLCFWGALIFSPEAQNPYFEGLRSDLGQTSGASQTPIQQPRIQRPILGSLSVPEWWIHH